MNMSEEVTGVTLQIAEKAVTAGLSAGEKLLETFARLFHEMMAIERERSNAHGRGSNSRNETTSVDLTHLKPGAVRLDDLQQDAKRLGDSVVTSENGVSREDMKAIARKAKQYGIPIAFKNPKSKGSLYACVRSSDLPIFKQVCTECIRDKIAEQSDALGNFRCEKWQIPFLTAEMQNFDAPAMFPHSAQGSFCLYEKKHEPLVNLARAEFVRKCQQLDTEIRFEHDDEGFFAVKDLRTGKQITFDEIPDQKTLSAQIQQQFGFDENKANMCAAKFGQEMLQPEQRKSFFQTDAQKEFQSAGMVALKEGDHPLTKPYQCWYLIPKKDEKPRLVYRDPESGKFAVLEPQRMSRKQMRAVLTEQLGITDQDTLNALAEKADRVSFSKAHDAAKNYRADHSFRMEHFKQSELIEYTNIGASGSEYSTKLKPIDSVEQRIDRTGKNVLGAPDVSCFEVAVTFRSTEMNAKGEPVSKEKSSKLSLSLSDKKTGMRILTEMYREQGIPEQTAKAMAREVFDKAATQSVDKVIEIEEVRSDAMAVAFGTVSAEVSTADKQAAASRIAEDLGVPAEAAEAVVAKGDEIKRETIAERVAAVQESRTDFDTAMNRMTERGQNKTDSMVVCAADDPSKHIVVSGSHNGDRVVHDYAVFHGQERTGTFTDAHTKDQNGEPLVGQNGRHAWTNLKQQMQENAGISGRDVLTFESMQEYEQYLSDRTFLSETEESGAGAAAKSDLPESKSAHSNGHEQHIAPAQQELNNAAAKAAPKPPGGDLPQMPTMTEQPVQRPRRRH